jgi:coproporphyrinogen III oxidase-like Fe-S oxidoreductase
VTAKLAEERFLVGLRLAQGLRLAPEEWTQYGSPIQRFLGDGLLTQKGDRLMLTNRGVMLSNEVIAEFITL